MARIVSVGAAQVGAIERADGRDGVVRRLIEMMRAAHAKGCDVVVFPELALTTYFPRWYIEDEAELDAFYETEMPSPATRPLFEEAEKLGIGFHLGYAELFEDASGKRRFNSAVLVDKSGKIVHKYRKIHLPGRPEPDPDFEFQALEKRYFEVGDLGFPTVRALGGVMGISICNDRRWAESYRVLALRGAEMVFIGYNTPTRSYWSDQDSPLAEFHNHLSLQAGAYQNCLWVIGVARAGVEDGSGLIGGTCIIAPTGEMVAKCATRGDELIVTDCDLDMAAPLKANLLNFALHRKIENYQLITQQAGITPPPED